MASLRSGAKPALHLSLAPDQTGQLAGTPGAGTRRAPSWGFNTSSDTYKRLAAFGGESMAALPSPLPSPHAGDEWGFLPDQPRRHRSDTGGTGASWLDGWGGSIGTNGTSRTVQDGPRTPGADEFGAFPIASTSSLSGSDGRSPLDERKSPARSKTSSFFGTSASSDDSSGALSPPPNPPSRQNSLKRREGSATLPLPPSPGWDQIVDPMRSSVASSSGGSWMDPTGDDKSSWNRGRGGSIGSIASTEGSLSRWPSLRSSTGAMMGRYASPERHERSIGSEADLADLRPRLAALNTSSLSPTAEHFASQPSASVLPRPMSSLPSAVEGSASLPRSRFINLDALDPTNSPSIPMNRRGQVSIDGTSERPMEGVAAHDFGSPRRRTSVEQERPREAADEMDLAPQLQPGESLGDYVVERLLGKGAFSRVALARQKEARPELQERTGRARTASRDGGIDGGVVAIKLVKRKTCEGNDRMRISVMREVEVLKVRPPRLRLIFSQTDARACTDDPTPFARGHVQLVQHLDLHCARARILRRRRALRFPRQLASAPDRAARTEDLWRAVLGGRLDARDLPRPPRHQAGE